VVTVKDIVRSLGDDVVKVHGDTDIVVLGPVSINNASYGHITFSSKPRDLEGSHAAAIICCADQPICNKTLIFVKDPRLSFIRVIGRFFSKPVERYISHLAFVSASVPPTTYIGAFSVIGDRCVIRENCTIHSNVTICSGTVLGNNITIHPGCVIGADGFGYQRNEQGQFEKFYHLGGVVIEDDVEIHGNTHIARGALSNTIIGRGTKIDAMCHIAHNVVIGRDCDITACTEISGSVTIGDRVHIGPNTSIRDGISIGSDSFIGIGSVITKDLEDGSTVMGSPARDAKDYKKMLEATKKLAGV